MNNLFTVQTAHRGERTTHMSNVLLEDAKEYASQLAREKQEAGYQVIDNRNNITLMRDASFKTYIILIIESEKVSA